MPRQSVVLYEFVTGGGWRSAYSDQLCPASLMTEGQAMLMALASDFGRLPEVDTRVICSGGNSRLWAGMLGCEAIDAGDRTDRMVLAEAAAQADWTLVVAPEFDGRLSERAAWVTRAGGKLLGCSLSSILLTADKHATAVHLGMRDIPVPEGSKIVGGTQLPHPLPWKRSVLKPRYGAGSQGIYLLDDEHALRATTWPIDMRLECFMPGQAASVAALCGPVGVFPLPACRQEISQDGQFQYLGGSSPLEAPLAARASRLAVAALSSIPGLLGYVGVDMVLGDHPGGGQDAVIEINPRLTTSYVGLRSLSTTNLAQGMLDVAEGRSPVLAFHSGRITFTAAGEVRSPE